MRFQTNTAQHTAIALANVFFLLLVIGAHLLLTAALLDLKNLPSICQWSYLMRLVETHTVNLLNAVVTKVLFAILAILDSIC